MKKLKFILIAAVVMLALFAAATTVGALEPLGGIEIDDLYVKWNAVAEPGAASYTVEVFLGSEPITAAGAEVVVNYYSANAALYACREIGSNGYYNYPFGDYRIFVTAKDMSGNVLSERTDMGLFRFDANNVRVLNCSTVTYSPGDGYGEAFTIYIPQTGIRGDPEFKTILRDCYFTPPEGSQFERWALGAPGDAVTVPNDTVITAVWKHVHQMNYVAMYEPTCTEDGQAGYYVCSCGLMSYDVEGTRVIGDISELAIPALGHDWDGGAVVKEATAEEPGSIVYTCLRDPSHVYYEEIPVLAPESETETETETEEVTEKPDEKDGDKTKRDDKATDTAEDTDDAADKEGDRAEGADKLPTKKTSPLVWIIPTAVVAAGGAAVAILSKTGKIDLKKLFKMK